MTNRITTVVEYQVTKAIKALQDTQKELGKTEISGKDLAEALSKGADEAAAELGKIDVASERMAKALGDDFVQARAEAGVSVQDMVMELNRLGVSFDAIAADADALAVSVRKLDSVQRPLGNVQASTKKVSTGMNDMARSSNYARGAIGSVVGGSASDLAALGGISSTVAQGLDQLASYAAEGDLNLRSMVAGAGAIAGVGAALWAVNQGAEQAAERAEDLEEAIRSLSTATDDALVEAYFEALRNSVLDGGEAVQQMADENLPGLKRALDVMTERGLLTAETQEYLASVIAEADRAAAQAAKTNEEYGDSAETVAASSQQAANDIERMYEAMGEAAQEEIAATQARLQAWLNQLDTIPDEKRTEIQAEIDAGRIGAAERLLNNLARTRFAAIFPVIQPATTSKGAAAAGTGSKVIGTVNDQVRELQKAVGAFNSTLNGMGSGGGGGGGGGGSSSPAENEAEKWDDAIAKLFEYGQFTRQEYMRYLEEQIAGEELLSDRRLELFRKLQSFKDQIAREDEERRKEQERAEKEAADEAKRRADEIARAAEQQEKALGNLIVNITNTSADPQSVVRAIEQARRMFGDRWLRG